MAGKQVWLHARLRAAGRALHSPEVSCRLTHRCYRLPFRRAFRTAHGPWAEREGIILRAEDESGRAGFGEIAPIPWFGTETLEEAAEVLKTLGGTVTPASLDHINERYGCVRFALAAAMTDISRLAAPADAAREGRDHHLRDAASAPNDSSATPARWPVAALLPAGKAALAAAGEAETKGYVAYKWKVGVLDTADELALLDDLLAKLSERAKLRLDANGVWSMRQAAQWLNRCADRPIEFVEQPVAPENVDALTGLAADFPTPIALDESIAGLSSLRTWLDRGWPGVLVVKPALLGSGTAVLALLSKHHADVVFSSALETAIGCQAALRTALQFDGRHRRALGFGTAPLFQDGKFDGVPAEPFVTLDGVTRLNPEAVWNALS